MEKVQIVAIVFGLPMAAVAICRIMKMIEVTSKQYYEVQLKLQMVDRGYSASEIERVVHVDVVPQQTQDWQPIAASKPMRV